MTPIVTTFDLSCADVHRNGCAHVSSARDAADVVRLAQAHGGAAHSYTGAYYTASRLAAMTAATMRHPVLTELRSVAAPTTGHVPRERA